MRSKYLVLLGVFALAACAQQPAATVDFRGSRPGELGTPSQVNQSVVSSGINQNAVLNAPNMPFSQLNGRVVTMSGYEAVTAEEGETLESIAILTGVDVMTLAQMNGLQPTTRFRAGDLVLLPENWRAGSAAVPNRSVVQNSSIQSESLDSPVLSQPQTSSTLFEPRNQAGLIVSPDNVSQVEPSQIQTSEASVRQHLVQSGETVFSISRQYGVTVGQIATYNNLPSNYSISVGQTLLIPANGIPAPNVVSGSQAVVLVPPSASAPLPEQPRRVPVLKSPELSKTSSASTEVVSTPAPSNSNAQFLKPVQGKIAKAYKSGGSSNEGISIEASDNSPVVAAQDGTVALVSQSVGGLGTVILIQHGDNWNTVYGRIDKAQVQKGQTVSRGQLIGYVAPSTPAEDATLHFEIRKGTKSVDPASLL